MFYAFLKKLNCFFQLFVLLLGILRTIRFSFGNIFYDTGFVPRVIFGPWVNCFWFLLVTICQLMQELNKTPVSNMKKFSMSENLFSHTPNLFANIKLNNFLISQLQIPNHLLYRLLTCQNVFYGVGDFAVGCQFFLQGLTRKITNFSKTQAELHLSADRQEFRLTRGYIFSHGTE